MSEFERFGVVHAESVIDVEHVIDRARALWRRASGKVPTAQVELYAKASSRIRVSQRSSAEDVELQLVRETGHALRVMPRGANRAAFAASGNTRTEVIELPGLNHLFQTAKTGSPAEYARIDETIAPIALDTIARWIAKQ